MVKKEILDIFEEKPADKVEPKFKVKYAGSEYNVLEVKDIAGVTFYGIEDEPNHIDYVKAENCEIISGYAIKENGSPYPTKPAVFLEQKPAWSEDDEEMAEDLIKGLLSSGKVYNLVHTSKEIADWLKSLKQRYTWKPSEKQMEALHNLNLIGKIDYVGQAQALIELYNDLREYHFGKKIEELRKTMNNATENFITEKKKYEATISEQKMCITALQMELELLRTKHENTNE